MSDYTGWTDNQGRPHGYKNVDGKPRVASTPYGYDVADGNLAGHAAQDITAEVNAATGVWTDLWGGAPTIPVCPVLSTAVQMEVVSSSAQDAVGGSGIASLKILCLTSTGAYQVLNPTLTGTTPVALGLVLHVNAAYCFTRGTAGTTDAVAAGNISIRLVGGAATVYSYIPLGRTYDPRFVFRVPVGMCGFLSDIIGSVTALSNNNTAQLQLVSNTGLSDGALTSVGLWVPKMTIQGGQGGLAMGQPLAVPHKFCAGAIVKARCRRVSGAGLADAQITGLGWIEEV